VAGRQVKLQERVGRRKGHGWLWREEIEVKICKQEKGN